MSLRLIAAVFVGSTLAGCAAMAPTYDRQASAYESFGGVPGGHDVSSAEEAAPRSERELRREFVSETNKWIGTPYAYGGESPRGLDCSAFVQILYRNVLGISLPRETASQRRVGSRIGRSNLMAGDLVFFDTGPRQSHVGVYLGGGEFSHASSSAGVSISRLDEDYWNKRFEEAIRPDGVDVAANVPRIPATPARPANFDTEADLRRGW